MTRARVLVVTVSLLALAGIGVVTMGGAGDHTARVIAAPADAVVAPAEIVAAVDGRLEVLSAANGRVERELAGDPTGSTPVTQVAPTPDGATVYFTAGEQCGGRTPQLLRVASAGGAPELVSAVAASPRVSPDGRYLAYATSGVPEPGDCGPLDTLVVRDLVTGALQRLDFGTSVGGVAPLAWTPDSRRVATAGWFQQSRGDVGYSSVDVTVNGLTVDGRLPSLGGSGFSLAGNGLAYLPTGEAISAFPTNTSARIATVDRASGDQVRLVVEVPRPLYLLDADAGGTSFLLIGPLADTPDGHDLFRASVADPTPVPLASHVTSAAWLGTALPEVAASSATSSTSSTSSTTSTSSSGSTTTTTSTTTPAATSNSTTPTSSTTGPGSPDPPSTPTVPVPSEGKSPASG